MRARNFSLQTLPGTAELHAASLQTNEWLATDARGHFVRVWAYCGGGLGGGGKLLSEVAAVAAPWSGAGTGKRLLGTAGTLFGRASSEDFMYALFFVVHALVLELDVVRYTVNPTWEKGVLGNAREFKKMADCCGDEILAAVSDPETKKAIDLVSE